MNRRSFLTSAACAAPLIAAMRAGAAAPKITYVTLRSLASAYGLKVAAHGDSLVSLTSDWATLRFVPSTRQMWINGTLVWLNDSVNDGGTQYTIHPSDHLKTIDPVLKPHRHLSGYRATTVVLDPGHGGEDSGTSGAGGLREDLLTLDVAKRVRTKLANAGYKVFLTRETDRAIELTERDVRARKLGAEMFVSLHFNSTVSRSISGFETYALTPRGFTSTAGGDSSWRMNSSYSGNRHDAANSVLAYHIQRKLRLTLGSPADRGVRRARFAVLKEAPCPATLVELGFLSHGKTEAALRTSWYLDRLAQCVADGIGEYAKAVKAARQIKADEARKSTNP